MQTEVNMIRFVFTQKKSGQQDSSEVKQTGVIKTKHQISGHAEESKSSPSIPRHHCAWPHAHHSSPTSSLKLRAHFVKFPSITFKNYDAFKGT